MLDYLRKIDWLPKEIRHLIKKYEDFVYKHQDENFTDEEIAKELDVEFSDIQKIKYSINKSQILELDNYLLNIGEDFIEAKERNNEDDPEISAYKEIMENQLKEQIKTLKEKEQLVLSLYYEKELTFKEIGEVIGVSESRISQIHSSIIIKLKKKMNQGDD
jgi:RNA polymerase sigma factor for flagellar operon FliA